MTESLVRQSPIHHLLNASQSEWGTIPSGPITLKFTSEEAEGATSQNLGLSDLSTLAKLGVNGASSESWLREQGIMIPARVYETGRLEDGGLICRWAAEEFFLESGPGHRVVPSVSDSLRAGVPDVFRVDREEASFLLTGQRALEVLSQTCGIDLREAALGQLILTRVAGAVCGVLPERVQDVPAFRLWTDPSYAVYLWETLVTICEELSCCTIDGC